MRKLEDEGLVLRNHLTRREVTGENGIEQVQIEGIIECCNDLLIKVDKWLDVRKNKYGRPEVKAYSYCYHAWVRNTKQLVVRYDSAHGLDSLHRHCIDLISGQECKDTIPLENLPTLGGFIREAVGRHAALQSPLDTGPIT